MQSHLSHLSSSYCKSVFLALLAFLIEALWDLVILGFNKVQFKIKRGHYMRHRVMHMEKHTVEPKCIYHIFSLL